jgi:hypothetical protein
MVLFTWLADKGNLTFSFLKCDFSLSWFMLRILPLEKCNNLYLLYLSSFTGYILVACNTHFSKEYYFYSSLFWWLSSCNCAACLKPYKCAVKSRWMLFHTKYLACSFWERLGKIRRFPFRLNYKICWKGFWYFNKTLLEVILNHLPKQCALDR